MSQFKKTDLVLDHQFDPSRNRHYLNGQLTVLHCHHFTTLYTQLALDARETALLAEVAEDTFVSVLAGYFQHHGVSVLAERINLACQTYAALGLGKLAVNSLGDNSGDVVLERSHIDEGWLKKWGTYDRPVNYVTAGFIAALFATALNLPARTFAVTESESMAMGAKQGRFQVCRR